MKNYQDAFTELLQQLDEPAEISTMRQQAFDAFVAAGFPTRQTERWKYTNVRPLLQLPFNRATPSQLSNNINHALQLVFNNGHFNAAASALQHPGLTIKTYLHDSPVVSATPANSFLLLNQAFLSDSMIIDIKQSLTSPLYIIHRSNDNTGAHQHLQLQIRIANNCQATIIEKFIGQHDNTYFNNIVSDINLAPGARLHYGRLNLESCNGFNVTHTRAKLLADSFLEYATVDNGGNLVRHDFTVDHQAAGASSALFGYYAAQRQQHIDNTLDIKHSAEHTSSHTFYRGIIDDEAKAVFSGNIFVAEHAQQTNADLCNNNLLLSDRAEIDTKPALEIYADDVKCSHGATVGQLDDNMIFYLRSRGLSTQQATALLKAGFAKAALAKITDDTLREECLANSNIGELTTC